MLLRLQPPVDGAWLSLQPAEAVPIRNFGRNRRHPADLLTYVLSCNIVGYMSRNERLSVALHVLLHMAEHPGRPMTSEEMAACVGTNAVVIRRTFAGLRKAGIVTSVKGHGGGWRLARAPAAVSLAEIQQALGERFVSLTSTEDEPRCLLLRAVVHALDDAVAEAERVLERRLSTFTLADLADDAVRLHGAIPTRPGGSPHAV